MNRDTDTGGPLVRGFTAHGFRIDEETVLEAALLTVEAARLWSPPPFTALTEAALEPVLGDSPEFILLGTGASLVQPSPALAAALDRRGIGIEAMDSRAAARAWGVLRGEGRQIAAALYPLTAQA